MNKESHMEQKKPQNKLKCGVNYINVDYLAIAGFNFTKCVFFLLRLGGWFFNSKSQFESDWPTGG